MAKAMNSMKMKRGPKKMMKKGNLDPSLSGMETLKDHMVKSPAMKGGGKKGHHTMGKDHAGPKKKK